MADGGCYLYLRTPAGGSGGVLAVHEPHTEAAVLSGVTSPPLAPQGTGVEPSTPARAAASPALSAATMQSPSHLELEDFSQVAAAHPGMGVELTTLAAKLTRLKEEVAVWQKRGDVRGGSASQVLAPR